MVEHTTSVPHAQRRPGPDSPAATVPAAADGAARAGQPGPRPTCQHCRQPLFEDSLWGWMHAGSRYLCQDPATGEPLCQAATPA
ncbi:hypothetical protein [Micromonospora sp. NPDC004551]|uniref:hypothetical protein n=1 Tax=Micromonospora sp. NPDC004551 TaxID=3154284 RepID=UPI0033AA0880